MVEYNVVKSNFKNYKIFNLSNKKESNIFVLVLFVLVLNNLS